MELMPWLNLMHFCDRREMNQENRKGRKGKGTETSNWEAHEAAKAKQFRTTVPSFLDSRFSSDFPAFLFFLIKFISL
jgi:hypothetical protein